jgi:hypothetical protein
MNLYENGIEFLINLIIMTKNHKNIDKCYLYLI